jgi:hypothetical protein
MSPLIPLLLTLSGFTRAADNVCPGWGPEAPQELNAVYNRIRLTTTYDRRDAMREEPVWFPQARTATDAKGKVSVQRDMSGGVVYAPLPSVFDGAGALAFAPNLSLNKGNPKPVVVATIQLFEIAHNADEAAFVFAHEFAHLELGHPQLLDAEISRQFDAWSKAKSDDYWATAKPGQGAEDFRKDRGDALARFQQPLEDQADARGRELMQAAGFDPNGAATLLAHAAQWQRARVGDAAYAAMSKQTLDHRLPMDRAKAMAEQTARQSLPDGWYASVPAPAEAPSCR